MANFDSASKRFSGMQLGEVPETTLPVPDGAFGKPDRQHLLGLYSGIAFAAPGGFNAAWARMSNVMLRHGRDAFC